MGVLKRFKDIMSANVNDKLDKARNPEKAALKFLKELMQNLGDLKKELAPVLRMEAQARKAMESCKEQRDEYARCAEKAVRAGNDGDAKVLLSEKQNLDNRLRVLTTQYEMVHKNAEMMRQMHDKLVTDITQVQMRIQLIRSKVNVAEATQASNRIHDELQSYTKGQRTMDNWEAEVDHMLDEARAMTELNQGGQ